MTRSEIQAGVRSLVEAQALPDFVTGFDVSLGEFEGEPAVWVAFKMLPGDGRMTPETERRVGVIRRLQDELTNALLARFEGYYPYIHFVREAPLENAST